jgi:8-oxo-dGTP pyrophosphatase MutT (NUDIX family)
LTGLPKAASLRQFPPTHGKIALIVKENMSRIWKPAITVAAIVEKNGHFLLVEEQTEDGIRYNQPAGHLEPGETLEQAVVRETLEETAYNFTPTALLGIYLLHYQTSGQIPTRSYLRFAFVGNLGKHYDQPLDDGILRTVWMTKEEIIACRESHRSPLLIQCVEDFLQGQRAPLSLLSMHTAMLENSNG